jgi:hypothetical protein
MVKQLWVAIILIATTCIIYFQFFTIQKIRSIYQLINLRVSNEALDNNLAKQKVSVKVFDLRSDLIPREAYDRIKCRKSAEIYVATTLCVHDLAKDVYVSASIWENGVWEESILSLVLLYSIVIPFYSIVITSLLVAMFI